MAQSIERYFRVLAKSPTAGTRLWNPPADVYRTRNGWLVKIELAGVAPGDTEVEINCNLLRVTGVRRDTHYCEEDAHCHQLEISYSRFEKTLRFPTAIEGARIVRDYRDGLLILQLFTEQAAAANASCIEEN